MNASLNEGIMEGWLKEGMGDFEWLLQTGEAESGSNSAASVERTTSVSRALCVHSTMRSKASGCSCSTFRIVWISVFEASAIG